MRRIILLITMIAIGVNANSQMIDIKALNRAISERDKSAIQSQIQSLLTNESLLFLLGDKNPVLVLIDNNDFELVGYMLKAGWPPLYFDSREGHEGENCTLAYYALKKNNYNALKNIYKLGIYLKDQSKDVSVQEEHIEDIYGAIKLKCSEEILKYLLAQEKKIDKTYKYRATGSPQFEQGYLIHKIRGRNDFISLVERLGIAHQVNYLYIDNSSYFPKKMTILDLLKDDIAYLKSHDRDVSLVVAKYNYIEKLSGFDTLSAFRKMPESEINASTILNASVKTDALVLRNEPNRSAGKITVLKEGQELRVLSLSSHEKIDNIDDYWYIVITRNNEIGFCFGGYLSIIGMNRY